MIFLASAQSHMPGPPHIAHPDKLAHFLVYGLFATLLLRVFFQPGRKWRGIGLSMLVIALYGVSDEFHQSFTPGRSVEVADWVADTLGALVATVAYSYWPSYRKLLEKPLFRHLTVARVALPSAGRSLEAVSERVQE